MAKLLSKQEFESKLIVLLRQWQGEYLDNFGGIDMRNSSAEDQIEFIREYVGLMMLDGHSTDNLNRIERFLLMQTSGREAEMQIIFTGGNPDYVYVLIDMLRDIDVADVYAITEFNTIITRSEDHRIWTRKLAKEFIEELRGDLEFDYPAVKLKYNLNKENMTIRCTIKEEV
ncbi:MAG: hypothetical protein HZA17_02450 [Nitrospirae bacterium]|nr:hypothetical protein [Nitrospirota bacterium]